MLDARNTWMMRVNGSRDIGLVGSIARVRRVRSVFWTEAARRLYAPICMGMRIA